MQAVPLLKGNKLSLNHHIVKQYAKIFSGKLSQFNAHQIKRIIIKMLIMKVLKEEFIQNQHGMNSYLQIGPKYQDLLNNSIPFYITVDKKARKNKSEEVKQI